MFIKLMCIDFLRQSSRKASLAQLDDETTVEKIDLDDAHFHNFAVNSIDMQVGVKR